MQADRPHGDGQGGNKYRLEKPQSSSTVGCGKTKVLETRVFETHPFSLLGQSSLEATSTCTARSLLNTVLEQKREGTLYLEQERKTEWRLYLENIQNKLADIYCKGFQVCKREDREIVCIASLFSSSLLEGGGSNWRGEEPFLIYRLRRKGRVTVSASRGVSALFSVSAVFSIFSSLLIEVFSGRRDTKSMPTSMRRDTVESPSPHVAIEIDRGNWLAYPSFSLDKQLSLTLGDAQMKGLSTLFIVHTY